MAGLPTTSVFGSHPYPSPVTEGELQRNILWDLGDTVAGPAQGEWGFLKALDLWLFNRTALANEAIAQGPANCVAAPYNRYAINNAAATTPATGVMSVVGVWLPQNLVISNICFLPGTTGDVGPTNQWGVLMNSARVVVANTADGLTTAITASTPVTYAIANVAAGAATSYTTPSAGIYYIGVNITTTHSPTLSGNTGIAGRDTNITPILSGTSTTGNTTPIAVGGSAQTAITPVANTPYFYLT